MNYTHDQAIEIIRKHRDGVELECIPIDATKREDIDSLYRLLCAIKFGEEIIEKPKKKGNK